jgi:hypothetical protein
MIGRGGIPGDLEPVIPFWGSIGSRPGIAADRFGIRGARLP